MCETGARNDTRFVRRSSCGTKLLEALFRLSRIAAARHARKAIVQSRKKLQSFLNDERISAGRQSEIASFRRSGVKREWGGK
jgi:hypothetical protein